jgi:alpha-methylacyl-CoA racemase
MAGPLSGVRVVELVGIGPGPFAAMLLADAGAEVLRVHRADRAAKGHDPQDAPVLNRSRRSVGIDLKHHEGAETLLGLVERADALIEGFRPGVMERLGAGPDACRARNPRLVYGRMTGWGQEGPLAHAAGHDIDYIAVAGALAHFGREGAPPTPPLNLVGDFGGGGLYLAFGIVCAVLEARTSGEGQVVDAAMVDGAASLMAFIWGLRSGGRFTEVRGTNFLDTGAHYYDTYECADGEYVAVGAIEPQFYAELLDRLGLAGEPLPDQHDRAAWPELKQRLADVFRTRTREEWTALLEGSDACVAPVLTMSEAAEHRHLRARGTIVEVDGVLQPAPAPRFSRTPSDPPSAPARPGEHSRQALVDWGFDAAEVERLHEAGAVVSAPEAVASEVVK